MENQKFIESKIKEILEKYDTNAEIFLFGSRARGDFNNESDWDFLVLYDLPENTKKNNEIREEIVEEIELKTFDCINTIFHNKIIWHKEYPVTNIYKSISEEAHKI